MDTAGKKGRHCLACEYRRRMVITMKNMKITRRWLAAFFCLLAFSTAVPALPAYARTGKSSRSSHSSRSGRTRNSQRSGRRSAEAGEDKMRDTAGQVQKAFDEKDLSALASLCHYPLTFVDQNGNTKEIQSKKALKALGSQSIFTKEMRDIVSAVNTAKIQADGDSTLKIGGDAGVTLKKVKGKWKVAKIQMKAQSSAGNANLVQAAEQFQRTFYYRDLETLSRQCTYPVKVYWSDGTIQEISSGRQLMDLGENRLFTDELVSQVNQVDASSLSETNQRAQVGTICGFGMVKQNGEWKIDTIFQ